MPAARRSIGRSAMRWRPAATRGSRSRRAGAGRSVEMQPLTDRFLFSPSDLGGFLACEHLTQLDLAVALREARRPSYENAYAELLRAKGQEHEQTFLDALRKGGHSVVEVKLDTMRDFEAGRGRAAGVMGPR